MAAFQDAFEDADETLVVTPSVISFQAPTAASLAPTTAVDNHASAGVLQQASAATPEAEPEAADGETYEEYYSSDEECDESLYDLEDLAGRAGSRIAWNTLLHNHGSCWLDRPYQEAAKLASQSQQPETAGCRPSFGKALTRQGLVKLTTRLHTEAVC